MTSFDDVRWVASDEGQAALARAAQDAAIARRAAAKERRVKHAFECWAERSGDCRPGCSCRCHTARLREVVDQLRGHDWRVEVLDIKAPGTDLFGILLIRDGRPWETLLEVRQARSAALRDDQRRELAEAASSRRELIESLLAVAPETESEKAAAWGR
jgi:hypothetical protein